jgi:hypothetical protein
MQNKIFEQLRKVKIIGETALLCIKLKKIHAVSLIPHAKYAQSIKKHTVYVRELSYPTTTKIFKFRGAT